jgi:hypothetical protein
MGYPLGRAVPAAVLTLFGASLVSADPTPGSVVVDETFGFTLRRPVDSIDGAVRPTGRDDRVERARFLIESRRWSLSVLVHATPEGAGPDAVVDALQEAMTVQAPSARTGARTNVRIASRDGVIATLRVSVAGEDWVQYVAAAPLPPNRHLVLRFDSPVATGQAARRVFDTVLASVRFPGGAAKADLLDRARRRGRELVERVRDRVAEVDLIPERYLRISRDQQDVGLVRMAEYRDSDGVTEGFVVENQSFAFDADGAVRETHTVLYTSFDFVRERWQHGAWVYVPSPGEAPQRRPTFHERALRERDRVVLTVAEDPGRTLPENKSLGLPADYVPLCWFEIVHRLVDLDAPRDYAFVGYSRALRGAATRVVRVGAAETIEVDGRRISAFRISDRPEVLGAEHHRFVDAHGRLIQAIRGRDRYRPIDRAGAEALLGAKLRRLGPRRNRLPSRNPPPNR